MELAAPVFSVANAVSARDYYVTCLGYEVHFEWSDPGAEAPRHVILRNGRTELHLTEGTPHRPSVAYVFVNGVEGLYEKIRQTDANITEPLTDFPWQMREFEVSDADGNRLVFGEHLSRIEDAATA